MHSIMIRVSRATIHLVFLAVGLFPVQAHTDAKLPDEYSEVVQRRVNQASNWKSFEATYFFRTNLPVDSTGFPGGPDLTSCTAQIQEGRVKLKYDGEMLFLQYLRDSAYAVCETGTTKSLSNFVTAEANLWIVGPDIAYRVNRTVRTEPAAFLAITTGSLHCRATQ
jgi:hypothetical protein